MMNSVIHIIAVHDRTDAATFSGAESHLFTLIEAQRAKGQRVAIVFIVLEDGKNIVQKTGELEALGIEVIPMHVGPGCRLLPHLLRALSKACGLMVRLRRQLTSRRDWVIHTHLEHADIVGRTAARLAGCRTIVASIHNDEPYYSRCYWRWTLRTLDRITTHYIAISQRVRQHMMQNVAIDAQRITTIRYGLCPPQTIGCRDELRRRHGLPSDRFVVGFVGRLTDQKNIPLLLEALRRRRDLYGVIVGEGELRRDLQQQAAALDNVKFLGYVPQGADLMPAFDLLCLPSRWEGLGLVLIEAMFRKVPIVGARAGAIAEILGEAKYGLLFDSDNVGQLVEAFDFCTDNPDVLQGLVIRAHEYATQSFTVERMVKQTQMVYERAAIASSERKYAST
jgi:glycosyltransferase involved in cell wall biosynthesis